MKGDILMLHEDSSSFWFLLLFASLSSCNGSFFLFSFALPAPSSYCPVSRILVWTFLYTCNCVTITYAQAHTHTHRETHEFFVSASVCACACACVCVMGPTYIAPVQLLSLNILYHFSFSVAPFLHSKST